MSKEVMNDQPQDIIEGEVTQITPELAPAALVVLTTKDLQVRIQEETEQRRLITEFISQHMKAGTDYGTIKFTKRDGSEVESKPSLFKPGSEKFCSLFHFRPVFERDNDTWEMSGKTPGLFTYKCNLVAANGSIVGEGRGSASVGEKQGWTVNNAIKIAEKRAQIDAVLRTGGLSDFFTQDLEDMPKEAFGGENNTAPAPQYKREPQDPRPQQPAPQPENGNQQKKEYTPDPNRPLQGAMTPNQNAMIFKQINRLQTTKEEVKARFEIEHISKLTKQQASDLIGKLIGLKEWGN
jgi:hypothetical protein